MCRKGAWGLWFDVPKGGKRKGAVAAALFCVGEEIDRKMEALDCALLICYLDDGDHQAERFRLYRVGRAEAESGATLPEQTEA